MEDLIEAIEEQLEWGVEDDGIRPYEFWGTDYNDVNMVPVLNTNEVTVTYPAARVSPDEMISLKERHSTEAPVGDDTFPTGWVAVLTSVTITGTGEYEAVYEVEQDDY